MGWFIPTVLSTLAKQASDKTTQYNKAKEAQSNFDAQEEAFSNAIARMRTELAPFLKGEAQPGDIAFREEAAKSAGERTEANTKQFRRNLASAGITGGVGEGSVGTKGFAGIAENEADFLAGIDSKVAQTITDRQGQAKSAIGNLESQKSLSLANPQAAVDNALGEFRSGQVDSLENFGKNALPSLLPGFVGGVANMFQGNPFSGQETFGEGSVAPYQTKDASGNPLNVPAGGTSAQIPGAYDPGQLTQQASMQQLFKSLGIDTSLFAPTDVTKPGEPIPKKDMFGNIIGYDEAPLTNREKLKSNKTKTITPVQKIKINKDAQTYVDKVGGSFGWESEQDRLDFYNATLEAMSTGKPLPKRTDFGVGRRAYKPTDSLGIL